MDYLPRDIILNLVKYLINKEDITLNIKKNINNTKKLFQEISREKELTKKYINLRNNKLEIECYEIFKVYENWKDFRKFFDRKNLFIGSGIAILVHWKWFYSYNNIKKYKIIVDEYEEEMNSDNSEDMLEYSDMTPDEQQKKYLNYLKSIIVHNNKKNLENDSCLYRDKDYIILNYANIWNGSDKCIKVFLDKKDLPKFQKFIKMEIRDYGRELKV